MASLMLFSNFEDHCKAVTGKIPHVVTESVSVQVSKLEGLDHNDAEAVGAAKRAALGEIVQLTEPFDIMLLDRVFYRGFAGFQAWADLVGQNMREWYFSKYPGNDFPDEPSFWMYMYFSPEREYWVTWKNELEWVRDNHQSFKPNWTDDLYIVIADRLRKARDENRRMWDAIQYAMQGANYTYTYAHTVITPVKSYDSDTFESYPQWSGEALENSLKVINHQLECVNWLIAMIDENAPKYADLDF